MHFFSVGPRLPSRPLSTASTLSIASLVAKLRAETGHSFSLCREALEKSQSDLETARRFLSELVAKQAASTQAKAATRSQSQGAIGIRRLNENTVGIVEIRCLSDFVGRSRPFLELGDRILASLNHVNNNLPLAIENHDEAVEQLTKTIPIKDVLSDTVGKLKEPITISRLHLIKSQPDETIGVYLHQPLSGSDFGPLAAVLSLRTSFAREPWLTELTNKLAKQVVGMNPGSVEALNEQPYLFNSSMTVSGKLSHDLAKHARSNSDSLLISRFYRLSIN